MTTPLVPAPLEQRLVSTGRALLAAVAAELGSDAPDLSYLTGPTPAVENCESGDGQLTVGLIRLLPGTPGRPDFAGPNQRASGSVKITMMTAEWHIELWRCFPVEEVNTAEVQDEAGVAWISDFAAIKRAVDNLAVPGSYGIPDRIPGASSAMISNLTALGPEGGSRGIRAVVQIGTG